MITNYGILCVNCGASISLQRLLQPTSTEPRPQGAVTLIAPGHSETLSRHA